MSHRLSIKQVVFVLLAVAMVIATLRPVASVAEDGSGSDLEGDPVATTIPLGDVTTTTVPEETTATTIVPVEETTTTSAAPEETTSTTAAPVEASADDQPEGDQPEDDRSDGDQPKDNRQGGSERTGGGIIQPAAHLEISKRVTSGPTVNSAGTYDLTYEVVVTNNGQGRGTYNLVDELRFGVGTTVEDASVANTTPGLPATNPGWDGVTDLSVVTGRGIKAGATHTYTITVEAGVAVAITKTARDCALTKGENGTGFLNQATLAFEGTETLATGCAAVPKPGIEIRKSLVSGPTLTGNGTYELTYEVVVANSGQGPGTYDLVDELQFGDGTTVVNASVAATGDITTNPNWDGVTDFTAAAGVGIGSGGLHTYTVNVEAEVEATIVTTSTADCELTDGEDGTGFLNLAMAVVGSIATTATDCEPVPGAAIDVTKTLTSGPALNAAGNYDVTYEITLTNTGQGSGLYDLDDQLRFGGGITVVDAAVSNTHGIATNADWDGIAVTTVVAGEPIAAADSHTYQVTIEASVAATTSTTAGDCDLTQDENGTGFLNQATVTIGDDEIAVDDCADVPNSLLRLTKSLVTGPVLNDRGTYDLVYDIVVTNDGEGPGTYDLDDHLLWGDGVTLLHGSVTNSVPGTITTNPQWNGTSDTAVATGVGISALTEHTYRVSVEADVAPTVTTESANCSLIQTETGTGYLNQASLTVGDVTLLSDDCAQSPEPGIHLSKTVTSSPTLNGDGTYDVAYEITVFNNGQGPGTYDLDDELMFGGGVSVATAEVASTAGGVATNPGWDGVDDTRVATGVGIAANTVHTYEVTVTASVALTISDEAGDCVLVTTEDGTGFLNSASITVNGQEKEAVDCVPVPSNTLEVEKTLTSGPTRNTDGTYDLVYEIEVTNIGEGPGAYDLDDELRYGDGVVVLDASIANTTPGDMATSGAWDGITDTSVVTGVAIAPQTSHVYTVEVRASVAVGITDSAGDCVLASDEDGTGFLNTAILIADGGETEASDCAKVPGRDAAQPTDPDDPELPFTGLPTQLLVVIGLAMLLGGAALVRTVRQTAPETPRSRRRDEIE